VPTFPQKGQFQASKKSQLALIKNDFAPAFQAYDEGSIPFTRSNRFNHLGRGHRAIPTSGLPLNALSA
jgi:hypothetical protein